MDIKPIDPYELTLLGLQPSIQPTDKPFITVGEDRLELSSATPKQFVQLLDDKVEIIGNRKQRTEVIETRTEVDGEVVQADIETLIEELPLEPSEAQAALGALDPDRLRSLLFDD